MISKHFQRLSYMGQGSSQHIKTPHFAVCPDLIFRGRFFDKCTEWLNAGVECMGVGTLLTKRFASRNCKNAARLRKKSDTFVN